METGSDRRKKNDDQYRYQPHPDFIDEEMQELAMDVNKTKVITCCIKDEYKIINITSMEST